MCIQRCGYESMCRDEGVRDRMGGKAGRNLSKLSRAAVRE